MNDRIRRDGGSLIEVNRVSKSFLRPGARRLTIRENVLALFRTPPLERFRVLDEIDLRIERGESFGIMGRNGSGKSTLLKIIAGIYTADRGEVRVRGQLTPILELGVGWNWELDAIDNIELLGCVMGMTLGELRAATDEILDFAGVAEFAHLPLKHFSSGMAQRLAYAVAFRAVREILVLDEIFAVGDAEFKHRCYERFRDLRRAGHTILLVSHDPNDIARFCDRGIVLDQGSIAYAGDGPGVAAAYEQLVSRNESAAPAHSPGEHHAAIAQVVERGLEFLSTEQSVDGEFPMLRSCELYDSSELREPLAIDWRHEPSPFFTSLVVNCLCCLPESEPAEQLRERGCRFLSRVRAEDGVWSWNVTQPGQIHFVAPDSDDTACALIALHRSGKPVDLEEMLDLFDQNRQEDGRFRTWMPDRWDLPAGSELPFVAFYRELATHPDYKDRIEACETEYFDRMYVEDVEPITNLNVASFLALGGRQSPAVAKYAVEFVRSGAFARGTVYYPSPTVFAYFFSRAMVEAGVQGLESCSRDVVRQLQSLQHPTEGGWGNALETAVAVCALVNFGVHDQTVDRGLESLLAAQADDGGWPLESFVWASPEYFKVPSPHHGARSLTTAFAIEALAKFERLRN